MNLPSSVTLEDMGDNYPVLRIEGPVADARIALHGGHIMEWTPRGDRPVLYLSPAMSFLRGEAIRGGIPVCWPWFGPHPQDPQLGSHGLARGRFWRWDSIHEDENGVRVRMDLRDDAETLALWPHAFHLTIDIHVGKTLEVRLTTRNTGKGPFVVGGALHTYLRVGEIRRVRIEGLQGKVYLDTVGSPREHRQSGAVIFDREVDRIYRHGGGCRVVDEAWCREIEVTQSGAKDVVVWNPWSKKGAGLRHLSPGGFHDFVCVEAANADGNLPLVEPCGAHTMTATIRAVATGARQDDALKA